jgi:hypothetical protein
MKLALTKEQAAELQTVFACIDAGQIVIGQIRRSPYPNDDAGAFVLVYTLATQKTAGKIRMLLEREQAGKTLSSHIGGTSPH